MLSEDIDNLRTKLREGNKEKQSLVDRIKLLEEKVKDLTKELTDKLKKHEKIEYRLKAGQVAYYFEQSLCMFFRFAKIFKNDNISRPCCCY